MIKSWGIQSLSLFYSFSLSLSCRSFKFYSVSLVEALREFLESFRLPGEAPVISGILEKFSAHWLVRYYCVL